MFQRIREEGGLSPKCNIYIILSPHRLSQKRNEKKIKGIIFHEHIKI